MNKRTNKAGRITIRLANAQDRESIYRFRHEVYSTELGQHQAQPAGKITDSIDAFNTYLIAETGGEIAGFISVTPPGFKRYSVDKYIERSEFSLLFDAGTYEVRLLTVLRTHRGHAIAPLLMYAAYRWVQSRGGTRIIGIGRREVLELYRKVGMQALEREIQAGAVKFELISAEICHLQKVCAKYANVLNRICRMTDWRLEFPFHEAAKCFHGGAFFDAIGPEFDRLEKRNQIINADVLDAWFPPSPRVIAALQQNLEWLLRTSPPTDCAGMTSAIARARRVPRECILPGAGSSDLIFLALRRWLTPESRVLLLDPTYGEYAHILQHVVHCRVERFTLFREEGYRVNLRRLEETIQRGTDLVILVNPNSPTGRHVPKSELERVLARVPKSTQVWVDETYVEYIGEDESLETFATKQSNVVICKSLSKVYALSGARAAYLCASPQIVEDLRSITPPWAVSLPAQVATVKALEDREYYAHRYAQTRQLREDLGQKLSEYLGWEVVPGTANFLLCQLPINGPDAAEIVRRCRTRGLFLRDASAMGSRLGRRALRVAVKDEETNRRMIGILMNCISQKPNGQKTPALIAQPWLGC